MSQTMRLDSNIQSKSSNKVNSFENCTNAQKFNIIYLVTCLSLHIWEPSLRLLWERIENQLLVYVSFQSDGHHVNVNYYWH